MDITPEQLKLSLERLNDSLTSTQLELIKRYRSVLNEVEASIRMRATLKPPPLVWRFQFWSPVIDTNREMKIWNPKSHRHGISPDPIGAAKTNLRAVGTVQFFRDGQITLDTVKMIAPRLIEMVDSVEPSKDLLAAHCARLKDRARNNATNEAVPYIQDALQRLEMDEDPLSVWKLEIAQLFIKHLAGAIDIDYNFEYVEEPSHAWAKAAFEDLLHNVQNSTPSTYSYSQFVE
jgi:hypothetical protein